MPVVIAPVAPPSPRFDLAPGAARIDIGFINNMPDGGFLATERRFAALLGEAADEVPVFLHLYTLKDSDRFERAREHARTSYRPLEALRGASLDAVIVTGTEPHKADLRDEPYWGALTEVVDWAERNTISTIFSCLAAHAAVLHRDGIPRRRLARKCTGVFEETVGAGHPLMRGISKVPIPHSRWNNLREDDLATGGYSILMKSAAAGVGAFVKHTRCLSVFFQSHFEYNTDTLWREYQRDVRRYLRGECPGYPDAPLNYLDEATRRAAEEARARVVSAGDRAALARDYAFPDAAPLLQNSWRSAGVGIYRNWLQYILAVKLQRAELGDVPGAGYPDPVIRLQDFDRFDRLRAAAANGPSGAGLSRYADDGSRHDRGRGAGERVMVSITRFLARSFG